MRRRRQPTEPTREQRCHQRALSLLVVKYPREFIDLATIQMAVLPNGGSRLPWRYTKQFNDALDHAEEQLRLRHLDEWTVMVAQVAIKDITPEDFQ